MKNTLKTVLAAALIVPVVALTITAPVGALGLREGMNTARHGSESEMPEEISTGGASSTVKAVVNFILWVVGIVAVLMFIWGGWKYITSSGDAGKLQSAKSTILYAAIGLVVVLFAYAIVSFTIDWSKSV